MRHHPLGKAAATAVALAALTGCGGGSSSSPDATGPTSNTTPSPSPSSDTSSPAPSSSSVAPATGRKLDVEGFSVRTPPGFDRELAALARNKAIANAKTSDQITAAYISSIGQVPLSDAVQLAKRNTLGGVKLKRLPDTEIAGQTFYHLAGKLDRSYTEEYGALVGGALCFVRFDLESASVARQKVVAATMASFTLD